MLAVILRFTEVAVPWSDALVSTVFWLSWLSCNDRVGARSWIVASGVPFALGHRLGIVFSGFVSASLRLALSLSPFCPTG